MNIYPLITAPCFAAGKDTPWGGNMLSDAFMKDAPANAGRSIEASADAECGALVREGSCAGRTIASMVNLWGEALTGTGVTEFPVNVQLIDAMQAPGVDLTPGVSRVWVILNCEPGSAIELNGTSVTVRPGDVFYIPCGAILKAGAGMQIYEASAAKFSTPIEASNQHLYGTTVLCKGGSCTYYACDEQLQVARLNVAGKMPVNDARMLVLTPFAPCTISCGDEHKDLMPFDTVIIPAALDGVSIESEDCKVFMVSVSNREALRAELGYRAANVPGLTD